MIIRPAIAADLGGIAAVFAACWHAAYPGIVPAQVLSRVDEHSSVRRWAPLVESAGEDWQVDVAVETANGVIGVARYGRDPDEPAHGHLFSLYVHPAHAGCGQGAKLLERALGWFALQQLPEATLWVFEANSVARRFYERRHWHPDGGRRVEPGLEVPEIRLRRTIVPEELGQLETERARPELADIDLLTTTELLRLMNQEDATVPAAMASALPVIARAVDAIAERMTQGGRLIYVGAGTAGRLGVLDASECVPTFNSRPGQVVGLMAGGRRALSQAVEGAEDEPGDGEADLRDLALASVDSVVGISASGRTPYVLGALLYARHVGALTVGIAGNRGATLSELVEHPIEVLVGPELIAGSTRLKSGTAQKLVLNMISTACMVRLGKTYGNLMVDLRASNRKLKDRSRRIVIQATGRSPAEADAALAEAGDSVKEAILMLELGVNVETASGLLSTVGGRLRDALERGRGLA